MWLDRFSVHSTPSGSPPPQARSYSPAPRRTNHLTPNSIPPRPGYSPRSTSLSLAPTLATSTTSLPAAARIPNSSALRLVASQPADVPDSLNVLQGLLGLPASSAVSNERRENQAHEAQEEIEFGGLDLRAFVDSSLNEDTGLEDTLAKAEVDALGDCLQAYFPNRFCAYRLILVVLQINGSNQSLRTCIVRLW